MSLCAQRQGSIILAAERGRGKSTALAFALKQILDAKPVAPGWPSHIVLVTPPRHAGEPVQRALNLLYASSGDACSEVGVTIDKLPPDAALARCQCADSAIARQTLLIVDEAASISLALLNKLRAVYPRNIMATTTGGYEGSGSGFAQRFTQHPDTILCTLLQPIRWAPGDPLEAFSRDLLCAESTQVKPGSSTTTAPAAARQSARAGEVIVAMAERSELANDEALLRSVFGLLAAAHYQTEPRDLRFMLDAP
ncbi:MAG: tRNA(Met) cytidine acetyltransferase, partial [Pseudomonadales bacterium]|nr:tRNA(Met) cytidine acetyltransferase [Pseudomonadales bacterium]